ncbi:MmgE/PrpD family protein [Mailhella massiliensis]|uniref:MmgE/PrpD family protein n=1 Tax=Mailhella massiliensis TaxID=1903261 RepID=A0A921DSB5_9BACT|nr:MmgE/PrpD family protein [Mailhella massiliensis]HJD98389.1 MmgE/PrpD family protein [Mailhella massiliensis]
MENNITKKLAEGLSAIRFEDIPGDVLRNMKRSILENLSAAVASHAGVPYLAKLDASMRRPSRGECTVFGGKRDCDPARAAFINASCAVAKEFIGGHRFSYGMPSIAAVPVAFALGESRGASGKEVLLAALKGYEAHARTGVATYPMYFRFHPHGTLGVYGAAGAAASMMGLDAERFYHLLNLVSVLPIFAHRRTTVEGGTVRNTYPGIAAWHGILALDMLEAGICGVEDGIRTCFAETSAEQGVDEHALLDGLGSRFEVSRNYYKLYGCERHLHGAMECVYDLREELGWDAVNKDTVDSVQVHTHKKGARCMRKDPQNAMAAQWSIPHGVAALLVLGRTENDLFSEEAVQNPEIRALAQRVDVFEDPEYTKLDPVERYTRLTLNLKDGRSFTRTIHQLPGEFDCPCPDEVVWERLVSKCRWLFGMGGLDAARTEEAVEKIMHLEELSSIFELTDMLQAG